MAKFKLKLDTKQIKQYLFEKGELVALCAALGILGIFFLYGIYAIVVNTSPHGAIHKEVDALNAKIASAAPDKEPPIDPKGPEWKLGLPGNEFSSASWYDGNAAGDNKRRNPPVLMAETTDRAMVKAIQMVVYRGMVAIYGVDTVGKSVQSVKDKAEASKLIKGARPVTFVEVTCLFPYKDQIELFKKALRVADFDQLLKGNMAPLFEGCIVERAEVQPDGTVKNQKKIYWAGADGRTEMSDGVKKLLSVAYIDENNAVALGAYVANIVGPRLEVLPASDKLPVKPDLTGINAEVVGGTGPRGPGGREVAPPNLLSGIGRPPVGKGQDPEGVKIGTTPFKELPKFLVARFRGDFNPFDPYGNNPEPAVDEKGAPNPKGRPGKEGVRPINPNPIPGPGGMSPDQQRKTAKPLEEIPADGKILIRFIDTDLRPGVTYQYSIQIRMANPNYKQADKVAFPALAEVKELLSPPAVTPTVTVPADFHYYFVDMIPPPASRVEAVDKSNRLDFERAQPNQIAVQVHKWVGEFQGSDGLDRKVGDWAVADRMLFSRGETIGRTAEVEIPEWSDAKGEFVLGATAVKGTKGGTIPGRQRVHGVAIDFTRSGVTPSIVDFDGGRVTAKSKVDEECATEILLMTPDGKLFVRNSRDDYDKDLTTGKERHDTYASWRARVDAIRQANQPALPDKKGGKGG